MKRMLLSLLLLATPVLAADKPNIIVILADDLGFSDLGCYGSEIATPNLDRLATNGLRFTRFYNSAKCEPTRASLMSGQYWQDCGLGVQKGPTLGQAVRPAGYDTFAVGKWHLSGNPVERGFDHYFGHLSGASDYFKGSPSHRLDNQPFAPKDTTFYTTDANAEYAVKFLGEAHQKQPDKPFFLYLAFNAPHAPIQAWPEDIAKYRGKYRIGWDKLRAQRYQRQLELGIMKKEWALSPRPDTVPAWDTLTEKEQDFEDLRMSIYAAMVDRMDQAVGRVLAKVKEMGEEENTLVLFLSDNGASPFDHQRDRQASVLESSWEYGLGWANASVTPFRHYKRNMFNGGQCTPCIAFWPAGIKQRGAVTDQTAHIIDLMATLVDLGGATWPAEFEGKAVAPLPGKSLRPIFAGEQRAPHDALYFQLFDHRAVMVGDWKLVSDWDRSWELFNLAADRTELHNLAAAEPERAARLQKLWQDWSDKTGTVRFHSAGGEPVYRHLSDAEETYVGSGVEREGRAKKEKPRKTERKPGAAAKSNAIRARVGTTLAVANGQLVLACTGDDPGLSFDTLPGLEAAGPYTLAFRLQSRASGEGELYWTAEAGTPLPKGRHQAFAVVHDGQWHEVTLKIPEKGLLCALRLDPCAGPGEVRIESLRLTDAAGKMLKCWP